MKKFITKLISTMINRLFLPRQCFSTDTRIIKDDRILNSEITENWNDDGGQSITIRLFRKIIKLKLTCNYDDVYIVNKPLTKKIINRKDKNILLGKLFKATNLQKDLFVVYGLVRTRKDGATRNDGILLADVEGYYWIDKSIDIDKFIKVNK